MKRWTGIKSNLLWTIPLLMIAATPATADWEAGQTFTFQGRLLEYGEPANGSYDFQFSLYNTASGGIQVGDTTLTTGCLVVDGLFKVDLDFGTNPSPFDGRAFWMEVTTRPYDENNPDAPFSGLFPRLSVSPTPYSLKAAGAAMADSVANNAVTSEKIQDLAVATCDLANGAVTADKLAAGAVTTNKIGNNQVTTAKISLDDNLTQASGKYFATDVIRARSASGLALADAAGNSRIIVTNGGTVGIGTTEPSHELEVSGRARVNALGINTEALEDVDGTVIVAQNSDIGGATMSIEQVNDSVSGSPAQGLKINLENNDCTYSSGYGLNSYVRGVSNSYAYVLYGDVDGGSENWGIYISGDEMNHLAGSLGLGVSPADKLDVNGVLRLRDATEPSASANCAKLYSKNGRGYAADSNGNKVLTTPHEDPRVLAANASTSFADSSVPYPWSFHHENTFLGREAIVDMAKMALWVQARMIAEQGPDHGRIFFERDLPAEEIQSIEHFMEQGIQDQIGEKLRETEWMEVALGEGGALPAGCWNEIDVTRAVKEMQTYTENVINWETLKVEEVTRQKQVTRHVPTGERRKVLKPGYKFEGGKIQRQRTINDLTTEEIAGIEMPQFPQWILDRMPPEQTAQALQRTVPDVIADLKAKFNQGKTLAQVME